MDVPQFVLSNGQLIQQNVQGLNQLNMATIGLPASSSIQTPNDHLKRPQPQILIIPINQMQLVTPNGQMVTTSHAGLQALSNQQPMMSILQPQPQQPSLYGCGVPNQSLSLPQIVTNSLGQILVVSPQVYGSNGELQPQQQQQRQKQVQIQPRSPIKTDCDSTIKKDVTPEAADRREANRLQKQRARQKRSAEEVELDRERCRVYKQRARELMSPEEAARRREEDRARLQRARNLLPPEEAARRRKEDQVCLQGARELMLSADVDRRREEDRVHLQRARELLSPEEAEIKREEQRIRMERARELLSPEDADNRREEYRLRIERARERLSLQEAGSDGGVNSASTIEPLTLNEAELEFDEQIGRFLVSRNLPSGIVEHPEFQKLLLMLCPAYKPPSARQIANLIRLDTKVMEANMPVARPALTQLATVKASRHRKDRPAVKSSSGSDKFFYDFEEGSIVWSKWNSNYWPAIVTNVNKRYRKLTVAFIDSPSKEPWQKSKVIERKFCDVVKFDNSLISTDLLLAGLKGRRELRNAIQKARNLIVKQALGPDNLNVLPTQDLNPIDQVLPQSKEEDYEDFTEGSDLLTVTKEPSNPSDVVDTVQRSVEEKAFSDSMTNTRMEECNVRIKSETIEGNSN